MSKEEFAGFNYTNTPAFSLTGLACWARMVACHDGDSPTFVFPYAGKMYRFLTRVHGIDTCEITSKDPALKERAVCARNRLIQLATGCETLPVLKSDKDIVAFLSNDVHLVWIECLDFDKYARPLVRVKRSPDDESSFADILIQEKLAYPYFGATKLTEKEQVETMV